MKNYLLTDFNKERWNGINLETVKEQVEKLNEKLNKIGCLFGEIVNPESLETSLKNVSHSIKNLTYLDGNVYGDIIFLNNESGKKGNDLISNKKYIFGIRAVGIFDNEINLRTILTWDIIAPVFVS